jgi:putative nucleotidyltransferase with HDIG domain
MQRPARFEADTAVSGWRPRVTPDPQELTVSGWLLELFNAPDYRPPLLPKVAVQLLAIARNADVRLTEIARLLEQDPMLTAVMLRISNSAVHRAGREVATIDEAIARLGLRRVTEIVLEAAVTARIFHARGYEGVMDELRFHSSATAHVARMLSRFASVDPSEAFVCGLLHDIGIAASLIAIGEHYEAKDLPGVETVWSAVHAHHAAAGALLQQSWGLPSDVGRVLAAHHQPLLIGAQPQDAPLSGQQFPTGTLGQAWQPKTSETAPDQALVAVVALADALVSECGAALLDEVSPGAVAAAQDALGIDQGLLDRARGNAQNLVARLER